MPYMNNLIKISTLVFLLFVFNCKKKKQVEDLELPIAQPINKVEAPEGMIWVETKTFLQGAKNNDKYAMPREKPAHNVTVDGFFIDVTEVTNYQFSAFVDATNYVTVAERKIEWEDMKKQLPPDAIKPHDSVLQPRSLIFNEDVDAIVNMNNYAQWWTWQVLSCK